MRAAPPPGSSPGSVEADRSSSSSGAAPLDRSPPPSPPSSAPSAASRLPNELLHAIFLLTAANPPNSKPLHGGSVHSWTSHERAAPLALVCKAWRAPAQSVLFSSVALIGTRQATLFVRTAQHPSSAHLTKKTLALVLGVDPAAEASRDGTLGQVEASELLVAALEACPAVAHIHLRPLASAVRGRLQQAVFAPTRRLRTLILSPRVLSTFPWSGNLWTADDAVHVDPLTSLENLEITTYVVPPAGPLAPAFPALPCMRRLKLHYNYPVELLLELLKKSPRLEYIDLYFETLKPLQETAETLKVSAANVRELRYICNPTLPELDTVLTTPTAASQTPSTLFDLVLPFYTSLETLRVSSTDISPFALLSLPPKLRKLTVKNLSVHSRFSCAGLIALLRGELPYPNRPFAFPDAFKELVVVDAPEQWEAEAYAGAAPGETGTDLVTRMLRERGVRFTVKWDFEEEGEETSGSSGAGSGSGGSSGRRSFGEFEDGVEAVEGSGGRRGAPSEGSP
ncbi:hypothetical protein JCM8097_002703 [Rhodosporidiobolus ruineniae]